MTMLGENPCQGCKHSKLAHRAGLGVCTSEQCECKVYLSGEYRPEKPQIKLLGQPPNPAKRERAKKTPESKSGDIVQVIDQIICVRCRHYQSVHAMAFDDSDSAGGACNGFGCECWQFTIDPADENNWGQLDEIRTLGHVEPAKGNWKRRDTQASGKVADPLPKLATAVSPDAPRDPDSPQSHLQHRFDLVDGQAMFEMTHVLYEVAKKYGSESWRSISVEDHLNHLISHAYAYLAGNRDDQHLANIMCRAMFAQGKALMVEGDHASADETSSYVVKGRYQGQRRPVASMYHKNFVTESNEG